jgi:hypothetical protein
MEYQITKQLSVESPTAPEAAGCAWLMLNGEPHWLTTREVAALADALRALQFATPERSAS